MTSAVQAMQPGQAAGPQFGVCLIQGRIRSKRSITTQNGRLFLTLVTLPAADEYTSPATVELRSRAAVGDVGEQARVKARIGGRWRQYEAKDRETDELKQVQTADMTLEVIEA